MKNYIIGIIVKITRKCYSDCNNNLCERRNDMFITTNTTVLMKDHHNDVKQMALYFEKEQSRIFLYAHKISRTSHNIC